MSLFMPAQRPAGVRVGNNVEMNQDPVRIDKWLWAARLVKTRALAVDAIRGGRVRVNGQPAKPSKDVKPGDRLEFSAGVIRLEATIEGTAERRLPAAGAQQLYTETEESRAERERRIAEMRMTRPQGVDRNARPTKRERRQLEQVKGRRER
jgi:ribosome-associated heat shock protein Hsp15